MKFSEDWLSGFVDGKATFGVSYARVKDSPNLPIPFRVSFFFRLTIVNEKGLMRKIQNFVKDKTGVFLYLRSTEREALGIVTQTHFTIESNKRDEIYKLLKYFVSRLCSYKKVEMKKFIALIDYYIANREDFSRNVNVFLTFAEMVDDMRVYRPDRGRKYTYHYFLEEYGQKISSHSPVESLKRIKNKV